MNKLLPHEEALAEQLNNVPLPGEEQSWMAMQQMMKKDKRRVVPAIVLRYLGLSLLAIALLCGFWFVLHKNDVDTVQVAIVDSGKTSVIRPSANESTSAAPLPLGEDEPSPTQLTDNVTDDSGSNARVEDTKKVAQQADVALAVKAAKEAIPTSTTPKGDNTQTDAVSDIEKRSVKDLPVAIKQSPKASKTRVSVLAATSANDVKSIQSVQSGETKRSTARMVKLTETPSTFSGSFAGGGKKQQLKQNTQQKDNSNTTRAKKAANNDNVAINALASNNKKPSGRQLENSVDATTEGLLVNNAPASSDVQPLMQNTKLINGVVKPEATTHSDSVSNQVSNASQANAPKVAVPKPPKEGLLWSAGLSVHQQIPVAGQQMNYFGLNGKTNVLNDYIPGVYVRMEKPRKWFAQIGFQYGSPQQVRDIAYARKTLLTDSFTKEITTSLHLRKAYYNDLPVSFNYYILPNWSVGAGITYSWLNRTITEQQTLVKTLGTTSEVTTSQIVARPFTDSFLYKTKLNWQLQADYHWRRLTLGVRYSMDAQPYIRYTMPDGSKEQRKNWMLEFVLQFRLWQSRKGL